MAAGHTLVDQVPDVRAQRDGERLMDTSECAYLFLIALVLTAILWLVFRAAGAGGIGGFAVLLAA